MREASNEPLPTLPTRADDSHKGDHGRVLLVGGSRGMAGAISLSGLAALRSGAGLVTIATPRGAQATVASFSPCYMTVGLADNDDTFSVAAIEPILELAERADVVAIGPGMGPNGVVRTLVKRLYKYLAAPLVVDADALNSLAQLPTALQNPGGPRVLTPHPGEFARLTGRACPLQRAGAAMALAARDPTSQTVVVLKGAGTIIATSEQYATNKTGNPGMATGGAGDVLTGMIAALAGQGLDSWSAARLAVHVHGHAGDLAAKQWGEVSLIATDLVEHLPAAFQEEPC